jgi:uncharacterized membrane protein
MEMQHTESTGVDGRGLSRGLGWFSIGLGLAEVAAPRMLARAIGIDSNGRTPLTVRAMGARELANGFGILARPLRPGPLWTRVVGDVLDLALLAYAFRVKRTSSARLGAAIASVLGVAVLDVIASQRMQRAHAHAASPIVRAITIHKPASEVYAFWRNFEQLPMFMEYLERVDAIDDSRSHWIARTPLGMQIEWDAEIVEDRRGEKIAWRSVRGSKLPNSGTVTFTPTIDRRATEVRVELHMVAPGPIGASLAKLFAGPQIEGDLRRLKQVLEIGEVVRSDASIHRGPHPAQPPELEEGAQR